MKRDELIEQVSFRMKLVRSEMNYTQDHMAYILGVSKKTLVQVEKGRIVASWSVIVTLVTLFRDSEILKNLLGENPIETIETVAHDGLFRPKDKTLGGKTWWQEISQEGCFRLQQNVISQHYRILDEDDYRWFSTFNKEEANERLLLLAQSELNKKI